MSGSTELQVAAIKFLPLYRERYHRHIGIPAIDINALDPEERLRLIGDLWDSLCECPSDIELTLAQRAELNRRLDELESGQAKLVSWDEVKARLVS
ncbi:MAG: addiction module protein [Coriobacteriia bacterium]